MVPLDLTKTPPRGAHSPESLRDGRLRLCPPIGDEVLTRARHPASAGGTHPGCPLPPESVVSAQKRWATTDRKKPPLRHPLKCGECSIAPCGRRGYARCRGRGTPPGEAPCPGARYVPRLPTLHADLPSACAREQSFRDAPTKLSGPSKGTQEKPPHPKCGASNTAPCGRRGCSHLGGRGTYLGEAPCLGQYGSSPVQHGTSRCTIRHNTHTRREVRNPQSPAAEPTLDNALRTVDTCSIGPCGRRLPRRLSGRVCPRNAKRYLSGRGTLPTAVR